jgi:AcrR family transcriptional regulator
MIPVSHTGKPSAARGRILDTASRLFYAEGIHAVGIDRVIAEASVAKATFYHHFPSKDELVRAYVESQDRLGKIARAQLPQRPPREMLLAIFFGIDEAARLPIHRGCPFINATAEYPDPASPVRQAIAVHRLHFRDLLRDLVAADGHRDPHRTADILVALWDGLLIDSSIDRPPHLLELIRDAVERVLDATR